MVRFSIKIVNLCVGGKRFANPLRDRSLFVAGGSEEYEEGYINFWIYYGG